MERFERKITVVDIFMIALAVVSLGLLLYEDITRPSDAVRRQLYLIDLAIIGIFATEFLWRFVQAERKGTFLLTHWYEIIGMIPAAAFRAFRLVRLIRIVAIGSRFLRAADRSLGEALVHRQIDKYRNILVEELVDPLLVAMLLVTERVATKGNYGTAIARGLSKNRDAMAERFLEILRKDAALGLLLKTPGVGGALERLPGRLLDGAVEAVGNPEVDETIRQVIREVLVDLRREVARRDWRAPATPAVASAG